MSERNEIFKDDVPVFKTADQKPNVDPRIPSISREEAARQEFDLSAPPDEVAPLPSGGKTYPSNHPWSQSEVIYFRGMTTKEENILTNKALIKNGTMITELLKSSILDKRVNPLDLLSGDRNAIMVAIRASGYGADYKVKATCPSCGDVNQEPTFNLADLEVKRLDIDPIQPGTNAFQFVLPKSKKNVVFKFLTGRDEEEIQANADRMKKIKLADPDAAVISTALFASILSVDGITDRAKIRQFIDVMPARDSLALRNFMRDHDPGLIMRQEMKCTSCGESTEVPIPIGVSFFWPST